MRAAVNTGSSAMRAATAAMRAATVHTGSSAIHAAAATHAGSSARYADSSALHTGSPTMHAAAAMRAAPLARPYIDTAASWRRRCGRPASREWRCSPALPRECSVVRGVKNGTRTARMPCRDEATGRFYTDPGVGLAMVPVNRINPEHPLPPDIVEVIGADHIVPVVRDVPVKIPQDEETGKPEI
jgi:hypothetical protein